MDESKIIMLLTRPFEIGPQHLNDIRLKNVTKLQLGDCFFRSVEFSNKSTHRDKLRAKVFAHLISTCVQLKYLLVDNFKWLLHVTRYASRNLRNNALSNVQYVEFGIPSCNRGPKKSIHLGKRLLPFLVTNMPYLQTLRLWRPDDFPWTTSKFIF
ncbi:unnamed protein product [Rotaria socialis]|uniref:Uncharacterized protein n=2 Tax=Rotaria socialis TaxID=392032 RepID=A0A818BNF9_9BILA|nr:unnamed protein product [Rotaria socialis]